MERAYEMWAQSRETNVDEPTRRDRRCAHHVQGAQAEPYRGEVYLRALQRMRGSDAARAARQVEPFFWSDAKVVRVWLCGDCAATLGLG